MSQLFTILQEYGHLLEVKGSKFYCWLMPYADFPRRLEQVRAAHTKASHVIPAFRYFDAEGTLQEGASDDGEPSGTAGRPCLAILQGQSLVNVGAIIVRYFGGTKLGTGGLVRAYGGALRECLDLHADLIEWEPQDQLSLAVPYDQVQKLELEMRLFGDIPVERIHNSDGVVYCFTSPASYVQKLREQLILARLIEAQD